MKKTVCICMAILTVLSVLPGCSPSGTASSPDNQSSTPSPKAVINFEGIVTSINGDNFTLENGKTVIISSDTVFAGDPDTSNTVSNEIFVGNFIQGYTEDDPDTIQVTAGKIYYNEMVQTSGKLVVNFEGKITAVDNNRISLENGQTVLISDDTVFSIAGGVIKNVTLSEGYTIQGYTKDEPAASEITASRIHIITY